MKIKNLNVQVTDNTIEIMKQFIEYYEDVENLYDEYSCLCQEIRKKYNINEQEKIIEMIEKKINQNLIKRISIQDSSELKYEYNELKRTYEQLYVYKDIINTKKHLDTKTLKNYSQNNNEMEEYMNSTYPQLDKESKKHKLIMTKAIIEEQNELNIKEMYIIIKYIYELYMMIYKYKNKELSLKEKVKLKKLINKKQYIEIIVPLLINTIENFNEIEGNKIQDAIEKAKQEPSEIKITPQVTIITNAKTKSA